MHKPKVNEGILSTWVFNQDAIRRAHFIDDQWKLHKKIISLVPVTSHMEEYIAKALKTCLLELGGDKICIHYDCLQCIW